MCGKPQIDVCCCGGTGSGGGKDPGHTPGSGGGTTKPPAQDCTCTVIFRSIDIHDDGETSKGEWSLEMSVNGVVKRWNKGGVRVQTYTLNKEFKLSNCDTPIDIRVSGWELDSGSSSGGIFDFIEDNNDRLSDVNVAYPAPNADASVIRSYQARTSNATGDYTIHYDIVRTCKQVRVVAAAQIIRDMTGYARALEESGATLKARSEDDLVNLALTKLRRGGWTVVGTVGDRFILEGFPPVVRRGRDEKRDR